jgi:hypothetical protein
MIGDLIVLSVLTFFLLCGHMWLAERIVESPKQKH